MAKSIVGTMRLAEALKAEGHELPAECRDVEIIMEPQAAIVLKYVCFVNQDTLGQIGRALERMSREV